RVYQESVRRFLAFNRSARQGSGDENGARAKVIDGLQTPENGLLITKAQVMGWLASMADAEPASVRLRLAALKQFAKWLAEETDFNADAILLIKPPRLDQKPVPDLSEDEVAKLLR